MLEVHRAEVAESAVEPHAVVEGLPSAVSASVRLDVFEDDQSGLVLSIEGVPGQDFGLEGCLQKISIWALSWQLAARLMLGRMPWEASSCW